MASASGPLRTGSAAEQTASTSGSLALPQDAVEVGRILGAWGIKGGLRVKPFSSDPQALFAAEHWFLQASELPRPPGAAPARPLPRALKVVDARVQGDAVVATVDEIQDRDAAQALSGVRIFVSRSDFPAPSAEEFYWIDLIGLAVANRQGLDLGAVVGLIETGPHCVLRVLPGAALSEADERLIPFVDAYVDGVDLPGRRITVDWDADY